MKTIFVLTALLAAGLALPTGAATNCNMPTVTLAPAVHASCYVEAPPAAAGCHTNPATAPPSFLGGACGVFVGDKAVVAAGFNEFRPNADGWCSYVVVLVVSGVTEIYNECPGYTPEPFLP